MLSYKHINWDLPDAEIARQVKLTREAIRQTRKRLKKPRPLLFRVRMSSLRKEELLRESWRPHLTVTEYSDIIKASYGNTYRLLKKMNLKFLDGRKLNNGRRT